MLKSHLMKKDRTALRNACLLIFLLNWTGMVYSQQLSVTGTVTDVSSGLVIPGTNITIKGSTLGTISDQNGNYTIAVNSSDAVLLYSFIGYLSQEIQVNNRTIINIGLNPELVDLAARLQRCLGTKVNIKPQARGGKGGKIEISYYSSEEFERLLDLFEGR